MYASRYTFEVEKKWKGDSSPRLVVHNMGTSCDVSFKQLGGNYIIYAIRKKEGRLDDFATTYTAPKAGELMTWLCMRNIRSEYYGSDSLYSAEIELLDAAFPQEIELRSSFWSKWWLKAMLVVPVVFSSGYLAGFRRGGRLSS
ncbi:MAG: hypothetical protein AB8F78_15505 [Saprospiraceae bacterium]